MYAGSGTGTTPSQVAGYRKRGLYKEYCTDFAGDAPERAVSSQRWIQQAALALAL